MSDRQPHLSNPERAQRRLLLLIFVPMIFVAILFIALFWYLWHTDAHEGYTAETQGAVIKVDFTPRRTVMKQITTIHYRYQVGGRTFDDEVSEPSDLRKIYPAGRQLRVCYQPESPNLSYPLSTDSAKKCGDKIGS